MGKKQTHLLGMHPYYDLGKVVVFRDYVLHSCRNGARWFK